MIDSIFRNSKSKQNFYLQIQSERNSEKPISRPSLFSERRRSDAMPPVSATTIISTIESSTNLTNIYTDVKTLLHDFSPFLKSSKPDKSTIRKLAKQSLPFLTKSLSLIPKRLTQSPKIPEKCALQLFDVYSHCLDCLSLIVGELDGKPYAAEVQRVRFIHCLENWEEFTKAENEGFKVLDRFKEFVNSGKDGVYVPGLGKGVDPDVVVLVLEIVVTLVKCAAKRKSEFEGDYRKVVSLVNESEPWFVYGFALIEKGGLDAKDKEKLNKCDQFHHFMVSNLYLIALFLVEDVKCFGLEFIKGFCDVTFKEYKKSSVQNQMYKLVLKACSSLFSQIDNISNDIIVKGLEYFWDFMTRESKTGVEATLVSFLELVSYCANTCHGTNVKLCGSVSELLIQKGGSFHKEFVCSVLTLYGIGLSPNNQLKCESTYDSKKDSLLSALKLLHGKGHHQVSDSLKSSKCHSNLNGKEKNSHEIRIPHESFYWDALKFCCQSLAEYIHSHKKDIFSEAYNSFQCDELRLSTINDVFHQFADTFLKFKKATERDSETSTDNHRVISTVVVAALMLSFKTNQKVEESTLLVENVILSDWISVKRLKYLYVSLNNIAVILNQKKQVEEAIKALKLCCKATWSHLVNLCKMHVDKSHPPHEDVSEKVIADFVKEASDRTAFLLNLNQGDNFYKNNPIEDSLKCWSEAEALMPTIPTPYSLIKEFVKIKCFLSKHIKGENENDTSLYELLQLSKGFSKRALGRLLEEELFAYKEKGQLSPTFSIVMQTKIIGLLETELVHTSTCFQEINLKKSRVLIEKVRVLRARGQKHVDECIQCLADAISTLKSLHCAKESWRPQVQHLLIHAYLMRALCTMESVTNSNDSTYKSNFLQDIREYLEESHCNSDFLPDIDAALNLCLSLDHADEGCEKSQETLYIWYQIIDFLSIMGCLKFHDRLYDVIMGLLNEKNCPSTKAVSELWKNRRLSHGLCASPINHMFLETFSRHQIQIDSVEFWKRCLEELKPIVVGFDQTTDKLKQAAFEIISQVPLSSSTIFFSSQLYYDLSRRLISSGHMIEALSYAKEAHRLRSMLLQQKFEYLVDKVSKTFDEDGEIIEKSDYGIQSFKVKDIFVANSCDGCFLTPWNVLSCYLESLLQVGVIQDVLGNGTESEMLLLWGRNVSHYQCLPFFETSFSSMLGKLYCKQKLWRTAKKELDGAKETLTENRAIISCKRCACMLEISIDQQIGDLSLCSSCIPGKVLSMDRMLNARSSFQLAFDKLSEWRISNFISEKYRGNHAITNVSSCPGCASKMLEKNDSVTSFKPETKLRPKRSGTEKKKINPVTERQGTAVSQSHRMVTRLSSRKIVQTVLKDKKSGTAADFAHNATDSKAKSSAGEFVIDITSLSTGMKCWHCLYIKAADCNSLCNFTNMEWELVYRKLSLRLLVSIGKYYGVCNNYHEAQKLLLQSISILFNRDSSCSEYSSRSLIYLVETIGKSFSGDVLAVERAALIYYICWFILKGCPCKCTRDCEISCIGVTKIVSLLKLAFILSQEAPSLNQKISRLLAVIYLLSTTSLEYFTLSTIKEGSESRWASFFHQASLGSHLNHRIHSDMVHKTQSSNGSDSDACLFQASISTITEKLGSLRLTSESDCLEASVRRFYEGLPTTPVICISLVVGADAALLNELLLCSTPIRAWIMISHLSSDNQHIILLPLSETLEGDTLEDDASLSSFVFDCKKLNKQWKCPWFTSVIDEIAPVFRHILESNYHSSSDDFLKYIKEDSGLWWKQRNRLNESLNKFLQDLEELWLGAWKYLLLGEWPNPSYPDSVRKNLFGDKKQSLQHNLNKKCFVGVRPDASTKTSVDFESTVQLLYKRMHENSDNGIESVDKRPIILVLDFEVQMLPWENLPILRNREVYRMPSVGSICLTIDRCCQKEKWIHTTGTRAFPVIDPQDSYYLLNPDGDLCRTQLEFENWFKDQNIEGKTGTVPTIEELSVALKSHDLFIYFGHGSGTQYIPGHEIQKLNSCAATLLLGCSSGSLYFRGCYMPHGAPISYLLAGSPVTIANLWEVTDKDIDRFGKAMLNAWLREREAASVKCVECGVNLNKCKSFNCEHRPTIGSFMAEAREACNLAYLIGAAPVCYGVPTGITRRKKFLKVHFDI